MAPNFEEEPSGGGGGGATGVIEISPKEWENIILVDKLNMQTTAYAGRYG